MNKLLGHLWHSSLVVSGRLAPGRRMTVFPDDVFLISYPKSGNTWLRFLVGNLVYPDKPVTFADVERRVPSVYGLPDRVLRRLPKPRYLKTHEPFHPEYQNLIYVVRDPRDVAVSFYHYLVKIKELSPNSPVDLFVPDFIAEKVYTKFGPWAEHVMGWLAMKVSRKKFLFLRYEDLLSNTSKELLKVATFLGIEAAQERLENVVQQSSVKQMRELEKSQSQMWSTTKRTRKDVPFVREAKSGQWSRILSDDSVAAIERSWGPVMHALGYSLVNDPKVLAASSETWERWQAQVKAVWPNDPSKSLPDAFIKRGHS